MKDAAAERYERFQLEDALLDQRRLHLELGMSRSRGQVKRYHRGDNERRPARERACSPLQHS
jgi:hypothetical protein